MAGGAAGGGTVGCTGGWGRGSDWPPTPLGAWGVTMTGLLGDTVVPLVDGEPGTLVPRSGDAATGVGGVAGGDVAGATGVGALLIFLELPPKLPAPLQAVIIATTAADVRN